MIRAACCAIALAVLATLASGCGDDGAAKTTATVGAALHARLTSQGARVFAEHCRTCHPLLGVRSDDVHTDYAPPLDLDEVQPSAAYVRAIVEDGKVAMGAFGATLDAAQLRAVVAYVTETAGRNVTVPADTAPAELALGRGVYAERCQGCHALDGRPATDPNPIWAGTDFEDVRPSVAHVERMVRDGQREAMPSFRRRLSTVEIRAVALYVNAAAR